KTLGIPIIKGRDFTARDMEPGAPPVGVVNQRLVSRYFPNEDPVGRRITLGLPRPGNPWITIIGVAQNVPHRALDSNAEPDWYTSRVVSTQRHRFLFVRSAVPTAVLTGAVRKEMANIDPYQPLTSVKTMEEVISTTTAPRRFNALLLGAFAAIALLLATLGIYSVISYSITLRTQEIGIRMALGAQRPAILLMVMRKGILLTLTGTAVGLAGAFALTRWMSSMLFGVAASDPLTYVIVLLVSFGAAVLACALPARRATRVDPLVALRDEESTDYTDYYTIICVIFGLAFRRSLRHYSQSIPRILIADDQADVLAALSLLLKGERFQIESTSSPEGVLVTIDTHELDVVLIDLNYARDTTSGSEGLDLLSRIRAADPTLPVVVMTAWGSVDLAVEAMRRGARDFIQKPWDNARLLAVLRTQVELGEALRRGRRLEA